MKPNILTRRLTAAFIAAALLFAGASGMSGSSRLAYGAAKETATVYVTMSVKGDIAIADDRVMAEIPVKVKSEEGMTTIDAVMEAFHEEYKPDGYACDQFVSKLWGIETSSTLFFINDQSITSGVKAEPVRSGDRVIAAVTTDDRYYSDYFTYFEDNVKTGVTGAAITLSLKGYMGMTQNAKSEAIKDAELGIVTKDGFQKLEGVTTDEKGDAVVTLDRGTFSPGQTYFLSAKGTVPATATDWNSQGTPTVSVDAPIIAPVCKVTVDSKITDGVKNTKISSLKVKAVKGKLVLTWKKSDGYKVDNYQVFRSAKKNGAYKKVSTVKEKKCSDKDGLKKGSRYYYKVRGCRSIDGKSVYTQWSEKVGVKAK